MLKYNSIGNYQWNFTWNVTSDSDIRDWCRNIALDSSDNIYLVGETLDTSVFPVLSDMFLLKIAQESEPSNGDGNGFEISGYELFVFTTTIVLIIAVIIKKFRKN